MPVDLNARVTSLEKMDTFVDMARKIGFTGLAVSLPLGSPMIRTDSGVVILARIDLEGKKLDTLRKQVGHVRKQSVILSVPMRDTEISNWAAGDRRVDLLTLSEPTKDHVIRESTATLAAEAGIALEIPIAPLLASSGLDRSKILRVYRESVTTAMHAGMHIVLSSGATEPILMRAPSAMWFVGTLLGMDRRQSREAAYSVPDQIVAASEHKMRTESVSPGVEIVKEDG
ncbi:MAG: hypothetical protein C4K49_08780 [Candidatus Thorarchaeota archaeon]|nr:MAG: hypothetical protein C4K49_08780 [Candidatus Thorarchaeota archaeon]